MARQTVYRFDWDLDGDQNEDELEFIAGLIETHWNGERIAVDADLGLWDGHHHAVGLFDSVDDAIRACNPTEIYVENGRVFIKYIHHDGTNTYELRQLTAKGLAWMNNTADASRAWLGSHLLATKGYTRRFIAKGGSL